MVAKPEMNLHIYHMAVKTHFLIKCSDKLQIRIDHVSCKHEILIWNDILREVAMFPLVRRQAVGGKQPD